jgi:hypothetical protein
MQQTRRRPLFSLGQLVATPGALAALQKTGQGPQDFLSQGFSSPILGNHGHNSFRVVL